MFSGVFFLLKFRLRETPAGTCVLAYVREAVTGLTCPEHLFADPRDPSRSKPERPE
jgi:hypothetical protein